ncbi:ATP-binding protein [Bradyrhizobium sp. AUGA SZCCT0283]|uniref:PAS domain-containing sensor histidine kinase n=1 Tax=Bradyrhizobium sp. AUGA SZCCT0283 TaxID=2807671 RepID=UPI00201165AA|nr:ATP-binding protein [Bradyrhizobium sp. AUGA SZCCT0283]
MSRLIPYDKDVPSGLIERAGVAEAIALSPASEDAWIDVIRKMDEVYSELVQSQVELEQKNAELEEARQFIDSVVAAMTDVLIVCDRSGHIEQVNQALERLTGKSGKSLTGEPLEVLLAPGQEPLFDELRSKLHGGMSPGDCEISFIDSTGTPTLLSMSCSSRCDHKGRFVGLVLIGRPVGELRRAYTELAAAHQDLRQAQKQLVFSEKMAALGRLVAGVAHELNNPISFVFGNMHALKRYGGRLTKYLQAIDQGESPDRLLELRDSLKIDRILLDVGPLVEGTLEGAERVSEIVQDLRRFSSSQTEPLESFNVSRVVRTAISWVVKTTRIKPEVVLDLPDRLEVVGRRGPVHQIMVNLVQNAIDVMAEQPEQKLIVSGVREGQWVVVRVRDFGPGMSATAMKRLFEPFFTTKPIGKGTGLGLYVSYGLAEELGGQLEGANHEEGGAVFTLRLPAQEAQDASTHR